ncbi:uncharacterized protein [Melopsittacus undulatus]|uniref:uncharacterized protein n=1 Tax=Melopsittacus undulatus TaxID=13146 RepID=UPI00146D2959|nr:uncharacterized protein LOC101873916 [Melopsittacus undulatus]
MAVEPQAEPSSAPFTKAADEAGEVMVSPVPGDYQQEAGRAVVSPAQHEEEVLAAVTMIPGAESGISYLAPGADDEGEAAASPLSQGSQPQEEPAAFPEENDEEAKQELDCVSDKELSQGEALTMYNICVSPLVPELFQDARADIHLESSIRSNVGTNATSEAAGDLQSVSPVLAGATDTELAAPPLAGAAEEEQHPAPLTSVEQEQEEAPEAPSHGFDKEEG